MKPIYDSWVIIYEGDKIIGYTHTYQEAENVCQKNNNYSWEFARIMYQDKTQRNTIYNTLTQIVHSP
jgi:hypothetical protein